MNRDEVMLAADKAGLIPVMEMFEDELFHFAQLITQALLDECCGVVDYPNAVKIHNYFGLTINFWADY